jgi:hypothetical protein
MLPRTPDRLPHFVRVKRYGHRLMPWPECQLRDGVADAIQTVRASITIGSKAKVTQRLANRLRIEFGGCSAETMPADQLEPALCVLGELALLGCHFCREPKTFEQLTHFVNRVVGNGHKFPPRRGPMAGRLS